MLSENEELFLLNGDAEMVLKPEKSAKVDCEKKIQ